MRDYYEINVARDGKHLFATAERSISCSWELASILPTFRKKFPEEEGYKISVTKWECRGTEVDIEEIGRE